MGIYVTSVKKETGITVQPRVKEVSAFSSIHVIFKQLGMVFQYFPIY